MHLNEIIELPVNERSVAIRKAFAPYTKLVEVSESEPMAAIALLNLSHKREDVANILDNTMATATLMDWYHMEKCAQEIKWLHTHNVKYPDTRISGQRMIARLATPAINTVSSFYCIQRLGWSHNSSAVNKAKLFGSHLFHRETPTCLAGLIAENEQCWWNVFEALGMPHGQWLYLQKLFKEYLTTNLFPLSVNYRSVQVTFPYQGHDISITPVASHSMLSDIQIARKEKNGNFTTIKHWHASSVGDLASSLGGKVAVLNYPPNCGNSQNWKQKKYNNTESSQGVYFYERTLRSEGFITACEDIIISKQLQTQKERNILRRAAMHSLRVHLAEWLAPISYWRGKAHIETQSRGIGLAQLLIYTPDNQLIDHLVLINKELHAALVKYRATERFAYHPELLLPLKSQIKVLLKRLLQSQENKDSDKSSRYLHLKNLHVFDAQALSCPYVVGLPSMTALWGVVYNYQLLLQKLLSRNVLFDGVACFLRQYNFSGNAKIPEQNIPPSKSGGPVRRPGLIDMRYCDLRMDLVIRLHADSELGVLEERELPLIQAAFPGRFAGGIMQPPPLYDEPKWCLLHKDNESLSEVISTLPEEGRWIIASEEQPNSINSLVTYLAKRPYCLPTLTGYQMLEPPRERPGSHKLYHAYAEPLISVADMVSPARLRLQKPLYFFVNAFWRLKVENLTMLMVKA